MARNDVERVEFKDTSKRGRERAAAIEETLRKEGPRLVPPDPKRFRPPDEQRTTLPARLASALPTGASRDAVRMVLHGLARTGNTILRAIDIPNRVFGNTRSLLQDIYERSEANLERDAYEDRSGAPQVGETAVHLASAGVLGKALPAVFGANVGADTYETARYAGASEGEALAKGLGHGAVDTAIWTLGQGLASKYLPKAWQWLGREIVGAGRGAASSVTSDAVLNSLGADISGEEMAKRAVHAAWMVPLLGMLKMGGKRREDAMSLLRKARPDLAGEKVDKVIETIEAEFSDPRSQKVALAWVARKGANLPDDTAQIRQALEVSSKVKGLDPMSRSPFEILSDPAYARYLPKPRPQDVKAFSNMKRYPMGVIGFDVSDDAAGRQATREMINAYMSPSSNPWCLATGKDAVKLGGLGPGAEGYWKQHSAVPKQIFFQEVDGKLELTAFRATGPGGEGRQEYWDTSDAGYSGIPIKVKVPGDPMGRYEKYIFKPSKDQVSHNPVVEYSDEEGGPRSYSPRDLSQIITEREHGISSLLASGHLRDEPYIVRQEELMNLEKDALARYKPPQNEGEIQGTFENIAPGKVFKGDPFRDGRSQTWVEADPHRRPSDLSFWDTDDGRSNLYRDYLEGRVTRDEALHRLSEQLNARDEFGDNRGLEHDIDLIKNIRVDDIEGVSTPDDWGSKGQYVLVEDKVRTTENGITRFRTTRYADPTDWVYEPPKPGGQPKPVEIEESELVSPEWMRSRGYDPESESDVRRMQRDLNIQGWGNGAEAAMAIVPTKRTYLQTKSGTPETVTYWPNGRAIAAVDFVKDGVPYREEYDYAGPNWDMESPYDLYPGDSFYQLPRPEYGVSLTTGAVNRRLIRNPGTERAEVLDDVRVDEGLEGFVRTSGNRRWRMGVDGDIDLSGISLIQDALSNHQITRVQADEAYRRYTTPGHGRSVFLNPFTGEFSTLPASVAGPRLVVEDHQPDGTWVPVKTLNIQASPSRANTLPPPPDEIPMWAQQGLTDEALREEAEYNETRQRQYDEENGRVLPDGPRPPISAEEGRTLWQGLQNDDVPFALKAGRTRRNVRAAEGGGDAGPETAVSETPVSEAPQNPGGPRIVLNPAVFHDKRDALCVTFNEAFRLVMEENGFEPVSEPTEKQRKFFADTAYADDELQLRRTILARIATLDTSVSDPTDEQLEETAEMLEMVMEVGAPQNEWEQQAVQRLHDVVVKSLESTRANRTAKQPGPPEDKASAQADVGGGRTFGGVDDEEEAELKRLAEKADAQVAEEKEAKQFMEERGMDPLGAVPTMEEAMKAHEAEANAVLPQAADARPAGPVKGPDGYYHDSRGRITTQWNAEKELRENGRRPGAARPVAISAGFAASHPTMSFAAVQQQQQQQPAGRPAAVPDWDQPAVQGPDVANGDGTATRWLTAPGFARHRTKPFRKTPKTH